MSKHARSPRTGRGMAAVAMATALAGPALAQQTPAPEQVIITARPPRRFTEGAPGLRRLYPDFREEEERYFAKTGIFPIMHVIAMKRSVYEANRWIARNLFDAFDAAKRASITRLYNIQSSYIVTGWVPEDLRRTHRLLFGDGEPWPYGLEHNRATLEPFLAYCDEQGITQRRLTPDELFPKELAFEVKI